MATKLRELAVTAGVLGALVACRHEPTLDGAVQRSAGAAMVQPPDVSVRETCAMTEGTSDAEARLVCRRQCLVETSLHAEVSRMDGMFRGADGGSLLGSTPSVAMIPMLDGGVRWLTVTPLADGGTRCEDRAARQGGFESTVEPGPGRGGGQFAVYVRAGVTKASVEPQR